MSQICTEIGYFQMSHQYKIPVNDRVGVRLYNIQRHMDLEENTNYKEKKYFNNKDTNASQKGSYSEYLICLNKFLRWAP